MNENEQIIQDGTTTDYLNQLVTDRDNLADNLTAMGVPSEHIETFTELVPKVLQIPQGSGSNIQYITDNSDQNPFIWTENEPGIYAFYDETNQQLASSVYMQYDENANVQQMQFTGLLMLIDNTIDDPYVTGKQIGIIYNAPESKLIGVETAASPYNLTYSFAQGLENYVNTQFNQTIGGVKTFTSLPQSDAQPQNNTDLVNKKYVDDSIGKVTTMPTASSTNEGEVVQYMGVTDQDYTNGYFYECVGDGGDPETFSWVQKDVQPGSSYNLPIASDSTLGGVKVGSGLSIDASTGVLSNNIPITILNVENFVGSVGDLDGFAANNIRNEGIYLLTSTNQYNMKYLGIIHCYRDSFGQYELEYINLNYHMLATVGSQVIRAHRRQKSNGQSVSADTVFAKNVIQVPMYANPNSSYKIDGLTRYKGSLATIDDLINYYGIKTINQLTTSNKSSIVDAINELVTSISLIPQFDIEVVSALPTQDISTTTVYLLTNSSSETGNLYDEYIYVNNAWEKLGSQTIDLTNYYTKTETNTLLSGKVSQLDTMPTASASNLGEVVLYTGTTAGSYTNGHLYICVSDGQDPATYDWSEMSVQDLSNYYSKSEINGLLDNKVDSENSFNIKGYVESVEDLPHSQTSAPADNNVLWTDIIDEDSVAYIRDADPSTYTGQYYVIMHCGKDGRNTTSAEEEGTTWIVTTDYPDMVRLYRGGGTYGQDVTWGLLVLYDANKPVYVNNTAISRLTYLGTTSKSMRLNFDLRSLDVETQNYLQANETPFVYNWGNSSTLSGAIQSNHRVYAILDGQRFNYDDGYMVFMPKSENNDVAAPYVFQNPEEGETYFVGSDKQIYRANYNGNWEHISNTDLSGYYNKSEVNALVANNEIPFGIFDLTTSATSSDIVTAFGGSTAFDEIQEKLKTHKDVTFVYKDNYDTITTYPGRVHYTYKYNGVMRYITLDTVYSNQTTGQIHRRYIKLQYLTDTWSVTDVQDDVITTQDDLENATSQFAIFPTADASSLGRIVQYIGPTGGGYTQGYFYQVVSDGASTPTYSWEPINVQPAGGSSSGNVQYINQGSSRNPVILEDLDPGIYQTPYSEINIKRSSSSTATYIKSLDGRLTVLNKVDANTPDDTIILTYININDPDRGATGVVRKVSTFSAGTYGLSFGNFADIGFGAVTTGGNQTILGTKTFNILPKSSATPSSSDDFTTKIYVDSKSSGQTDTMPSPSYAIEGMVIQYIGATNVNYTNGYYYKCVEDTSTTPNSYKWVRIDVQPEHNRVPYTLNIIDTGNIQLFNTAEVPMGINGSTGTPVTTNTYFPGGITLNVEFYDTFLSVTQYQKNGTYVGITVGEVINGKYSYNLPEGYYYSISFIKGSIIGTTTSSFSADEIAALPNACSMYFTNGDGEIYKRLALIEGRELTTGLSNPMKAGYSIDGKEVLVVRGQINEPLDTYDIGHYVYQPSLPSGAVIEKVEGKSVDTTTGDMLFFPGGTIEPTYSGANDWIELNYSGTVTSYNRTYINIYYTV